GRGLFPRRRPCGRPSFFHFSGFHIQVVMRFLIALLCALLPLAASAQIPPAPRLAANAWLLIDHGTGQTLVSHNADARIEPASLTKLMTAYITFQTIRSGNLALEDSVQVSEKAWRMTGSRMF